jgi:hypothetical protein
MVSLSLVFSLLCGVGSALEQNQLITSVVLTNQNAYPGGTILASIYLKNNSTDILTIQYVGIQFDWMSSDQFYGYDLSSNPTVIIPSADQFVNSITMTLPENVTTGEHTYFVGVDGLQGTDSFMWDSQTFTLLVQDPKIEQYNYLLAQVSGNITESENNNYQSSKAQSLLTQANLAYEQALVFGNQNSWDEATSLFNNALTYLEQAEVEEQNYLADKGLQETLFIAIGIAVVVIAAILVIIYLTKRKKKSPVLAQTQTTT